MDDFSFATRSVGSAVDGLEVAGEGALDAVGLEGQLDQLYPGWDESRVQTTLLAEAARGDGKAYGQAATKKVILSSIGKRNFYARYFAKRGMAATKLTTMTPVTSAAGMAGAAIGQAVCGEDCATAGEWTGSILSAGLIGLSAGGPIGALAAAGVAAGGMIASATLVPVMDAVLGLIINEETIGAIFGPVWDKIYNAETQQKEMERIYSSRQAYVCGIDDLDYTNCETRKFYHPNGLYADTWDRAHQCYDEPCPSGQQRAATPYPDSNNRKFQPCTDEMLSETFFGEYLPKEFEITTTFTPGEGWNTRLGFFFRLLTTDDTLADNLVVLTLDGGRCPNHAFEFGLETDHPDYTHLRNKELPYTGGLMPNIATSKSLYSDKTQPGQDQKLRIRREAGKLSAWLNDVKILDGVDFPETIRSFGWKPSKTTITVSSLEIEDLNPADDTCVPYSQDTCQTLLTDLGVDLGDPANNYDFASATYNTKGCYYYSSSSPIYANKGFYGQMGTEAEMAAAPPEGSHRTRPAGHDCHQ